MFYRYVFSNDPTHRQQASSKWLSSFQDVCKIFQEYAPLALRQEASTKLLTQVRLETQNEEKVTAGMISNTLFLKRRRNFNFNDKMS